MHAVACKMPANLSPILHMQNSLYSLLPQRIAATHFNARLGRHEIAFDAKVAEVIVDIGLDDWGFFAPYTLANASAAVIGIEALPSSFCGTKARLNAWSARNGVATSRLPIMNVAVGPGDNFVKFNVAPASACGSILPTATTNDFWCAGSVEQVDVPIVPLSTIINLIPAHLRLRYMKIDVEGADLVVAKTGACAADPIVCFRSTTCSGQSAFAIRRRLD